MTPIVRFLTARSPLLMVASVALGLAWPWAAAALRPWVVPVSIIMVPLSVLRIDMGVLARAFRMPLRVGLAALAVLVGLPLAVGFAAMGLSAPPWMAAGLVLIAAAPPLSSAAAFAILLRIDAALVTAISLTATVAAPATLWLVSGLLPDLGGAIDATALIIRLAGLLAAAFAIAFVIRRTFGEARVRRAAPMIDAATVILVLVIGVGVMHEIGQSLRSDPRLWWTLFGATWAVSVTSCALSVGAFWWAGRDFALAAGVVAAVKNIALMVAAVAPVVSPEILLVVMTAQLPIFFAPLLLRPVFDRLQTGRTDPAKH